MSKLSNFQQVGPRQPDISLTSRIDQLEVEFCEKIEEINTKISNKIQIHEKEIEGLKKLLEEEKMFSKQLSDRILQLEASAAIPTPVKRDELLGRSNRLFRLLSPNLPG